MGSHLYHDTAVVLRTYKLGEADRIVVLATTRAIKHRGDTLGGPVLTVTHPQPGLNAPLTRLLIGMHDYYSGLDLPSFNVTADFAVNGAAPGENLAAHVRKETALYAKVVQSSGIKPE